MISTKKQTKSAPNLHLYLFGCLSLGVILAFVKEVDGMAFIAAAFVIGALIDSREVLTKEQDEPED